jgi:hypothetical protein
MSWLSSVTESSVTLPPVSKGAVVAGNHLDNQLLARLDRPLFALVEKHLRMTDLGQGHVIAETHQIIENVFVPPRNAALLRAIFCRPRAADSRLQRRSQCGIANLQMAFENAKVGRQRHTVDAGISFANDGRSALERK